MIFQVRFSRVDCEMEIQNLFHMRLCLQSFKVVVRLIAQKRLLNKIGTALKLLHEALKLLSEHKYKVCLLWWNLVMRNHIYTVSNMIQRRWNSASHCISCCRWCTYDVELFVWNWLLDVWLNMLNLLIQSQIDLWSFCFLLPFNVGNCEYNPHLNLHCTCISCLILLIFAFVLMLGISL